MGETKAYCSIPEAARLWGVSRATMWNWVKSGKIDAVVTPGGHHRISRQEMDRRMAERQSERGVQLPAKSILVVDDDPSVLTLYQRRLDQEGYQVITADNGFTAGLLVSLRHPDLVLLDLFMEGVDGFEVCRAIKGDPHLRHIKVLAISGHEDKTVRRRILDEGADGFVPKGTDLKTLSERIASLLQAT